MARKEKAPYLEPPTRPIFQTLPPELLHVIFAQVDIEDIIALRTTCSVFAAVGIDYLGDEVPLVYHRDKFKALTEIAAHPKLAKQMRSLFYVVDRCGLVKYETWDALRPDPRPWERDDYDHTAKAYTERDFRMFGREDVKEFVKAQQRTASVPESERRIAYEAFTALCHDQQAIDKEFYDRQCLRALFEGCAEIKEVTVASQMETCRRMEVARTAFRSAMTSPWRDRKWWQSGVDQVLSVAMAAQQAGTELNSLTLAGVSPWLFYRDGNFLTHEWDAIKALVRPLHRLRLYTYAQPPEEGDEDEDEDEEIVEDDPGIEIVH